MKKFLTALICVFVCAQASFAAGNCAVVDVQKIFNESKPAKAAAKHMTDVQSVLQNAMNTVLSLNAGREQNPDAQRAVAQSQEALNNQYNIELREVNITLQQELRKAVNTYLAGNKKIDVILPSVSALGFKDAADVTDGVMKEINKLTPEFRPLPEVSFNKPQDAGKAEEKKDAGK